MGTALKKLNQTTASASLIDKNWWISHNCQIPFSKYPFKLRAAYASLLCRLPAAHLKHMPFKGIFKHDSAFIERFFSSIKKFPIFKNQAAVPLLPCGMNDWSGQKKAAQITIQWFISMIPNMLQVISFHFRQTGWLDFQRNSTQKQHLNIWYL